MTVYSRFSVCAVAVTALFAGLAAEAQNPNPHLLRDDATAGAKHSAAKPLAPLAVGDRRFIEEATMGGLAEVELGKLAQIKGASEQVK
jgi:predicted outer membrane protein